MVWVHSIDAAKFFTVPRQSKFFHWENFGACGVDIFFAISGFVVSRVAAGRSKLQSAVRCSSRVSHASDYTRLPAVLDFDMFGRGYGSIGRHKIDWHSLHWLPTILLLPSPHYRGNAPLLSLGWTLMFEMYFYVILTAFMLWSPRSLVRTSAIFLSGMVVAGTVVGIHRPVLVMWMNPMILEFVFGCIIGLVFAHTRYHANNALGIGRWLAIIGSVLLAATIFFGYGKASEQDWIMAGYDCWLRVAVWGVPSALLVAGTIFWNPKMQSIPARLLVFLGDGSYSIYLCTVPAQSVVEHFWRVFGRFGADTGVLLGALFCTALGVTCYLWIERPLMRAFHNWYKPIPLHSTLS